jgi:hypothetical protein
MDMPMQMVAAASGFEFHDAAAGIRLQHKRRLRAPSRVLCTGLLVAAAFAGSGGLMAAQAGPQAHMFLPVAPSPASFMWQTLQTNFRTVTGRRCSGTIALAVSDHATCYTRADGNLMCNGSIYQTTYRGFRPTGMRNVDQIMLSPTFNAEDGNAICVHRKDGTVWCMGSAEMNAWGQFGIGAGIASPTFTRWGGANLPAVKRIGTGTWDQICGLTRNKDVLCSGESYPSTPTVVGTGSEFWVNTAGELSIDDPVVDRASAGRAECTVQSGKLVCPNLQLEIPGKSVVDGGMRRPNSSVGEASNDCALDSAGRVQCLSFTFDPSTPTVQPYFSFLKALALATNPYTRTMCAVARNGSLWCATEPGTETMVQRPGSFDTICR